MVGSTQWSTGTLNNLGVRNYQIVADTMNAANDADLQTFVDAIRVNNRTLMRAHADAFFGGQLHQTFLDTEDTWFGANPMWFWYSVLTPDQMHQVMRESRARTCELLLEGRKAGHDVSVRMFLQCGHLEFKTIITWNDADPAYAGPVLPNVSGISGQPWNPGPVDADTEIHVWVFTPDSAGYGDPAQLDDPLYAPRAQATAMLLAHLRSLPRQDIQATMTVQDYFDLATYSPGRRIYQGPLAVAPGTGILPHVAGLRVRYDVFDEPFANGALTPPMLAQPALGVSAARRPGIEITWQDVGPQPAPGRFAIPQPAQAGQPGALDQVQANILQPHVRNSCVVLLLQFADGASGRAFLRDLSPRVKSAAGHASNIAGYRRMVVADRPGGLIGEPYVGVGLSYVGYEFLGVPEDARPPDAAFRAGMSARQLDDPAANMWEGGLQPGAHAVVVIGSATEVQTGLSRAYIRALATAHGVTVLSEERGATLNNANGDGIEHFGYVDGRSQPLFVQDDVQQETDTSGTRVWDPERPLDDVLVPDPAHPGGQGSYFVFRKLEQNVRQFHVDVLGFAAALRLTGPDAARAGALLVGRFEDGAPLALQEGAGMHSPVTNDFDYQDDPNGLKCPFSSHMRLMNDRAASRLLARRGVPYGSRNKSAEQNDLANEPAGGVGLLFMAFASDLVAQFEALQLRANGSTGQFDPVVGQGQNPRPAVLWPPGWGNGFGANRNVPVRVPSIRQSVTMRGGEYFFMPSIPTLAALP